MSVLLTCHLPKRSVAFTLKSIGEVGLKAPLQSLHDNVTKHPSFFDPVLREQEEGESWHVQRDMTQHVNELEQTAFRRCKVMFYNSSTQVDNLNDELMGTTHMTNPVNSVENDQCTQGLERRAVVQRGIGCCS